MEAVATQPRACRSGNIERLDSGPCRDVWHVSIYIPNTLFAVNEVVDICVCASTCTRRHTT